MWAWNLCEPLFLRLFAHGFLPFYLHGILKFSSKRKQREVGRRGKRRLSGCLKEIDSWTGKMIQRIKILLLAEDTGSIPSTDMAAHRCP